MVGTFGLWRLEIMRRIIAILIVWLPRLAATNGGEDVHIRSEVRLNRLRVPWSDGLGKNGLYGLIVMYMASKGLEVRTPDKYITKRYPRN